MNQDSRRRKIGGVRPAILQASSITAEISQATR
jgi:hypothetical protein